VSRVAHTEHTAPCGRFVPGRKEVKTNLLLPHTGHLNFIIRNLPPGWQTQIYIQPALLPGLDYGLQVLPG